ncbi:uncharacterized protein ACRADG_004797 [Cochliomyia hominivorax]
MSSYQSLSNTNFDCDNNVNLSNSGTLHRMLKYWRNSPKKTVLKKSSSFIEYRKKQTNVIYQRLESYDESKLEKLRKSFQMAKISHMFCVMLYVIKIGIEYPIEID